MEGGWTSPERETEEVEEGEEMGKWPGSEKVQKGGGMVEKIVDFARSVMKSSKGFEFGDNSIM